VIGASLYIVICSAKNLVRVRLRRLREPRYLVGAIVGAVWVYFSFFRRYGRRPPRSFRRGGSNDAPPAAAMAAVSAVVQPLVGLVAMCVAAAAWIVPFSSGALDFSKAEVALLLPAPVSRRSLIAHRLLRSQIGILFGSAIVGLASPLSGTSRLRISIGAWLMMLALRVYAVGVTLTRARLRARNRRTAWLPIAVFVGGLAVVGVELFRALTTAPAGGVTDLVRQLALPATTGLSRFVLAPFVAVVRPMFADWPHPYLESLVLSAAVCAALVLWVLWSDDAFDDVVETRDQRVAAQVSAQPAYRARTGAWPLAPSGRVEGAFVWKAATQSLRAVDGRGLLRLVSMFAPLTVIAVIIGRDSGAAAVGCMFAVAASAMTVVLGPQVLRVDIRDDLQHLELLKTWPVEGAAVIRGEMVWPGTVLSAIAWFAIVVAVMLSDAVFGMVPLRDRGAMAASALVVAPALVFAQLLIHNAAAMLFPAWVPLGSQRARGLDAMGQRIITFGGALVVLLLMLLPAALPAAIVWVVARPVAGPFAIVPAAAAAAAAIAVEVLIGSEVIGPLFDRVDVTSVERAE
jgi:ABC-2 type transport system permease protein